MKTLLPPLDHRTMTWWLVASAGLLVVAFVASTLSDEFNWNAFDFLVAAVLLVVTGMIISLFASVRSQPQRTVLIVLTLLAAAVVWADLAVGLFGLPWSGN